MALLHPASPNSSHYLPIGFSGEKGELVFEASHRDHDAELHWHLDERYIGRTKGSHRMAFEVESGEHVMNIVDADGNRIQHRFEVMTREGRRTASSDEGS
jgi:penicillin-binding protein 1C